jgi:FkbM family methyltransferase
VPRTVRRRIRSILAYPTAFRLAGDRETLRAYRRLEDSGFDWGPDAKTVELRLKQLQNHAVNLRPRTSDTHVLRTVLFGEYQLPPPEFLRQDLHCIWDLGAHIGLATAHLTFTFPHARVFAVELEAENVALCRKNVAAFGNRCEVIQAAVWPSDSAVSQGPPAIPGHPDSFRARPLGGSSEETGPTAQGLSLNTLFSTHSPEGAIDFVKVDIEGAERDVLKQNTEWASRVRCMKIEVHSPYTVEECARDLQALGFATETELDPPTCIAIRDS